MILNEQTYKNLNRPYYIGRMKGYDRSRASHNNYFYLTTDLLYAIFYAGREGAVEEYRLKHGINIFNAKSKKDYYVLRLALLKDPVLNTFTKYLDDLKTKDWTFILGGFGNRDKIFDLLIGLGYDGYFNYEYTSDLKDNLRKRLIDPPVFESEPAIGVLNTDNFRKVAEYGYDVFKNTDAFDRLKVLEKSNAEGINSMGVRNNLSKNIIKLMLSNKDYITLSNNETDELVDNFHLTEQDLEHRKFLLENTNARYILRRD